MKKKDLGIEEVLEEDEQELAQLERLKEAAPDDVLTRLQKRLRVAQFGKDLIEKQAFAFWAVIDAFLKMMFVPPKTKNEKQNGGEK